MIRGYPGRPSVAPGQRLALHVSTDAPRFRVAFHRWGDGFQAMQTSDWLPGADAPAGVPQTDWQWPPYLFDIPQDWPSGVYIAHLQEPEPTPLAVAMDHAAALFVVRGSGRSRLLYKLPFATWQAYNCTGGACFYFQPPRSSDPERPGARLTWRRPGGGIGGETFGAPDYYDTTSPRQTFAHWDAGFIRWLIRQGYDDIEFCADLDVHEDPELLARHRLLVSVGHDEYWTEAMREHVERFVAQGGNASFFAANLCWWRIHLIDGNSAMVCHQGGPKGAQDHWWPESGVHRPEDSIAGVSYRHGGGWWDGPRVSAGFIVQRAGHWVFAGTGLHQGDRFGVDSTPPLAGYECDGAALSWAHEADGKVAVASRAAECGTPQRFVPLAVAPLNAGWQELPHREHHGPCEGLHTATMGICETASRVDEKASGTVFTVGTTDWSQVLTSGSDPHVPAITRNVLRELGGLDQRRPAADESG